MATNGNDLIFFSGTVGPLTLTLVNPYSGVTINVNDTKNINDQAYNGLGGTDTLLMTNIGDALFLFDGFGNQMLQNVEIILAGDGGDIIHLAHAVTTLNNLQVFGGASDDILWTNSWDDTVSGAGGDDIMDGGPGNDLLLGEDDNDQIWGGAGNDTVDGGFGHDTLMGGAGADNFVSGYDNDTIFEAADGSIDIITMPTGITFGNLTFSDPDNDLIITVGGLGTITIEGQFDSPTSGIDTLFFSNGTQYDLRSFFHNVPPVAQDDDVATNEDVVLTGNVLADNGHGVDTDANGDALSVTPGTFATAHGSVVLAGDGNFTYTPAADYSGTDSFGYNLLDTHGGSDTGTVNIVIAPVNDDPLAQDDDVATNEDAPVGGNVLADNGHGVDSDIDGGLLSVVAASFSTAHGSVVLAGDGSFTYTPAANYFGTDSFDYTLLDGQGGSDTGTVNILIAAVNDDPVAQDDDFGTDEDIAVAGNVLNDNGHGADSDIDGGVLSVVAATFATTHGSVVLAGDGSFTYTPVADYFGADSFDYTLLDGQGGSDTGTVNIVIVSMNDAPVAADDDLSTNEDIPVGGNVLPDNGHGVDTDSDGGILSVVAASFTTAHGSVVLGGDGSFTYTPAANYFGADSFDYTLLDGQGGSDTGTVNIVIASVNDDPVAQDDDFAGNEDTPINGNVLTNNGYGLDSDIDGGVLSVAAATIATAHGSVVLAGDGTFTYTPTANYSGTDSFDYTLLDGQGGSDTGTVNIVITSMNDDPVAQDDDFNTNEDVAVNGNVLGNNGHGTDSDSDGGTLNVIAAAFSTAHGSVVLTGDGSFTYTPTANYFGTDSFDYTLLDGQGGSDTGTVNIVITSVNDDPVAQDDDFAGNQDTAINGNVLVNNGHGADSDIDGGILSVVAGTFTTVHNGTVVLSAGGSFTYTPATGFSGADSFNYTLLDGQGGSDTALVNLAVLATSVNTIEGTNGNDCIIGTDIADVINALGGKDKVSGLGGDDVINGGNGADTLYGGQGNDSLYGGEGEDTLYGGNGGNDTIIMDKAFHDDITFPKVKEGKNISKLKPPGTPALGIHEGNLAVAEDHTATITFREGFAGYNNTLGIYSIAADGTIGPAQILWANVKTAGLNVAHQIDLPVGAEGGQFGFFIIANGNSVNGGYGGLNITGAGNVHFVYDYGLGTERAATINDAGTHVSAVYDDGVTERVLNGYSYHTTERGESTAINWDNKAHVISGQLNAENHDVLRIGFEDLPMLGDADYEDVLFDFNVNANVINIADTGSDTLVGGGGSDRMYGEAGNDILVVGEGADKIYGGAGSDLILYNYVDKKVDTIYGFETGAGKDVLNITDILEHYDPMTDNIGDFIRIITKSGHSELQMKGLDNSNKFVTFAAFDAIIADPLATLIAHGNLVVDQSVSV